MSMADDRQFLKPLLADVGGASHKSRAELLTLVQGIVEDGVVAESEAAFLKRWITDNESVRHAWPANVFYSRIEAMLSDGVFDPEEERELLASLLKFVETRRIAEINRKAVESLLDAPTEEGDAVFDDPEPAIVHAGRSFVLCGDFASARRAEVEARIAQLGGRVTREVSGRTDYVVIGGADAGDAARSGKVARAIALREAGAAVRIVREQHWYEAARGVAG
jgi:NAD-dependent DNA ligase